MVRFLFAVVVVALHAFVSVATLVYLGEPRAYARPLVSPIAGWFFYVITLLLMWIISSRSWTGRVIISLIHVLLGIQLAASVLNHFGFCLFSMLACLVHLVLWGAMAGKMYEEFRVRR